MAVREDILNFMRTIKSGKQAVKETEFKEGAYKDARTAYDASLEGYATELTNFKNDLSSYQGKVTAWEGDTTAKQTAYDAAQGKYSTDMNTYNTWLGSFTKMYGDPSKWSPARKTVFKSMTGYDVGSPPAVPSQPTFLPQPAALEAQHPGSMPSFEFVMPETPYGAALAKTSNMGQLPSTEGNSQQQYYQAITAQQNQPKWWQR